MGSLTSRPKISTGTQVVYVPAPSTTTTTTTSAQNPADPDSLAAEDVTALRKQSILDKSRGRFSTILTGFRGVLGLNDNAASSGRKTLLGE